MFKGVSEKRSQKHSFKETCLGENGEKGTESYYAYLR